MLISSSPMQTMEEEDSKTKFDRVQRVSMGSLLTLVYVRMGPTDVFLYIQPHLFTLVAVQTSPPTLPSTHTRTHTHLHANTHSYTCVQNKGSECVPDHCSTYQASISLMRRLQPWAGGWDCCSSPLFSLFLFSLPPFSLPKYLFLSGPKAPHDCTHAAFFFFFCMHTTA